MQGRPIQLLDMLCQCPRLWHLKISWDSPFCFTFGTQCKLLFPTLRYLEVSNGPLSNPIIQNILPLFPGLHVLRLAVHIKRYEHFEKIRYYCPNLQQLLLWSRNEESATTNALLQHDHGEGCRSVSIRQVPFRGDCIARFLKENSATVESFELLKYSPCTPPILTFVNDPVSLDRLRSLRYDRNLQRPEMKVIEWIVLRAPNIEFVDVTDGGVLGIILHALIHQRIRGITLVSSGPSNSVEEYEFLEHHAQLGVNSSLQEMKCNIYESFSGGGDWLHLIPKLQQLKSLELSLLRDNNLGLLTKLVPLVARGCISLEKITFNVLSFSSFGDWLLPLSQHPHLRSLLIASDMVSNDTLMTLQRFRHLESLHLKLNSFDWKAIDRLKNDMPCLVCTIQKANQ